MSTKLSDGRKGFCYQGLAALDEIRGHFKGRKLTVAIAIYQTLTYEANEQRQREDVEASRARLAELAGTSDRTIDLYAGKFERLGLLKIERRRNGQEHLPNLWTLLDGEGASPQAKRDRDCGEPRSPAVAKLSAHVSKKQTQEEGSTLNQLKRERRGSGRSYDEGTRSA